jgi:hypothetical protein
MHADFQHSPVVISQITQACPNLSSLLQTKGAAMPSLSNRQCYYQTSHTRKIIPHLQHDHVRSGAQRQNMFGTLGFFPVRAQGQGSLTITVNHQWTVQLQCFTKHIKLPKQLSERQTLPCHSTTSLILRFHCRSIKNRRGALPVQLKELHWCLYQRLYARADGQHV